MAEQIKVTGMVISSSPIGENDKRIVLLTREKGKISAFVRGARRPGNHLMAASDSFAFGSFYLYPGRDSYTMVNADITNYFRELASDVAKTYSAYYFLELAEYYSVENQDGTGMLNLIYPGTLERRNYFAFSRYYFYKFEINLFSEPRKKFCAGKYSGGNVNAVRRLFLKIFACVKNGMMFDF